MNHISVSEQDASAAAAADGLSSLEPDGPREMRYDATVPRWLVHRNAVAEVFATDSQRLEGDVFEVAAQLPRGHVMLEDQTYDLPVVLEACRQTGVLISHRHLDVPMDQAFIMQRMVLAVHDPVLLRQGPEPARMLVRVDADLHRSRSGRILGYDFQGEMLVNGGSLGTVGGALFFLRRKDYEVMRANGRAALDIDRSAQPRPAPCSPAVVGRRDPRNVVVSDPVQRREGGWSAIVVADRDHPHLFDHPLDHLPGNLLMEAARQLTAVSAARGGGLDPATLVPVAVAADFSQFCENDLTTVVEADPAPFRGDERLGAVAAADVRVLQRGNVCATMRVEVAQWA
ncbi:ScbA/BarX family gamma-butyrolactone biosynthesis protein [Nocardiopsis sp. NPDC050513]|uniref:ScbA/BarX family gamma-butyrolactone biosynthesis protein n=1 Tax=Nocardiopsis sp. NPDC050513 TaxID=3364338 RepID=UPI003799AEFA